MLQKQNVVHCTYDIFPTQGAAMVLFFPRYTL